MWSINVDHVFRYPLQELFVSPPPPVIDNLKVKT